MASSDETEIVRLVDPWALDTEHVKAGLYRVVIDDPLNVHVLLLHLTGAHGSVSCATLQVFSRTPGVNMRPSHLRSVSFDLDIVERAVRAGGSWRRPRDAGDERWATHQRALRDDGSDPIQNLWSLVQPRSQAEPQEARRALDEPLPPEHFEEVARLYDEAIKLGVPAIASYISEHMGNWAEQSTVRGWIARARRDGLLPPTKSGKKLGNIKKPEPFPREAQVVDPKHSPTR